MSYKIANIYDIVDMTISIESLESSLSSVCNIDVSQNTIHNFPATSRSPDIRGANIISNAAVDAFLEQSGVSRASKVAQQVASGA